MDIQKLGQQGYSAYLAILDTQEKIGKYNLDKPQAAELATGMLKYGRTTEEMIELYNSVLDAAKGGTRRLDSITDAAKLATGLAKILSESETVQDYMD